MAEENKPKSGRAGRKWMGGNEWNSWKACRRRPPNICHNRSCLCCEIGFWFIMVEGWGGNTVPECWTSRVSGLAQYLSWLGEDKHPGLSQCSMLENPGNPALCLPVP